MGEKSFSDTLQQGLKAGYVDFNRAKQVAFVDALQELGLLEKLRRDGDELKGICPLHGGEKESFGVNIAKRFFNCFACKQHGNVLDFVRLFKKVSVKDAGQWLVDFLERSKDRGETPAPGREDLGVLMQAMCRAIARYLAAVLPLLGDAAKIEGELSKLLGEEVGKVSGEK